jgi:ribonuclease P protein component
VESLKKNRDFKQVYNHRRSTANRLLVLYVKKNDLPVSRLGVSVSRKVGTAVVRNRIKRIIKEHIRLQSVLPGCDLVIVVRPAIPKDVSFKQIGQSLLDLLDRQKVLNKKND